MSSNKHNYVSNKINNVLVYGSCLLVLLLPIFYIGNTFYIYTSPKTFFFYGFVEILTAFWIYTLAIDSSYRPNKKTILYFIPLLCFITWMTISGILAVNPHLAFWSSIGRGTGLITLYHCFAFSLIIASLVKHNGLSYIYKLMKWFIWGGFLLSISVWFANEGFNLFFKESIGGGLMGNSSLAATYLLFSLAFGLFLLFAKKNIGRKWWLWTMMGTILFSPLFINIQGLFNGSGLLGSARGATLGILVMLCVSIILYLFISKKKIYRILGILGIIVGLAIFSLTWIQLVTPNTYLNNKFTKAASGTRFIFADIAQRSIDKHPYFGYGPENYPIAFQENLNPKMALSIYNSEVWADRAHNIYYDTGVSGGYPAIVFYFLFILSILYSLYNLRNKEHINHTQIAILGGLIIGYVFQNLFVFDSLYSIMALYILAGIIFASNNGQNEEKYLFKPLNTFKKDILPILLTIFCLVFLIIFSIRPFSKVSKYYNVAQMPMNIRGDHYSELIVGSKIGEDWDVGEITSRIYKLYNEDPRKIKNNPAMLTYAISDIKALISYAEKIYEKNQNDARLNICIVTLYNTLNYFTDNPYDPILGDHIFKLLDHMKIISPYNPETYWIMAQTYIWKEDYSGVVDSYMKAIAIDSSIPESHNLLLKFAQGTKNEKLYNEALMQAEKDIPGFKIE